MKNKPTAISNSKTIKLHQNALHTLAKLDIWESRYLNCCLVQNNQGKLFEETNEYPVDIGLYSKLTNLTYNQAYKKILEITERLYEVKLEIHTGTVIIHDRIIYKYTDDPIQKTIKIHWNRPIIPLVSGYMLPGEFLMPKVQACKLNSNKKYNLYLLLEKYLYTLTNEPYFALTKQEIRDVLDAPNYPFKEIVRRFIKPVLLFIHKELGKNVSYQIVLDKVRFSLEGITL